MSLVLEGEELPHKDEYIHTSDGVDFIPSSKYLSVIENQMRMEMGCDRILSEIVEPLRGDYDYILIDIGPTEGILTVNALCAADSVLIPMDLQLFALAGVREILTSVKKLKRRIKPNLELAGIVFNRYDTITNLSGQIQSDTREAYGGHIHLFRAAIPQTVDIGTAHYCSQPVALARPNSKATAAFKALAKEFILQVPDKAGEAPCC
jgi:chromosome partitioning protein